MRGRRALVVAVVAVLAAPAAAAGQAPDQPTELWRQFPLNPTPTPVAQQRAAVPIAQTGGGGGSSSTAWLIAGVLGLAGIGLTIAGLASARRDPEDEDLAAAAKRRDREADAAGRAQRRAARTEAESAGRPRAGAAPSEDRDAAALDSGGTRDAAAAAPDGRAVEAGSGDEARPAGRRRGRPKAPVAAAPAPPPAPTDDVDWEECRIALAVDGDDDHHFFAEHAGAGDPVARSPVFHARRSAAVMESAAARDALQALVTTLLAGGWQVVGRDEDAWALRFRRRVRAGDRVERHPAGR